MKNFLKSEKPNVVPDSQIPKQDRPVDLSKVIVSFTGTEIDQIVKYLSQRPWAEVTNIIDMIRVKLSQTNVNVETKENESNNQ